MSSVKGVYPYELDTTILVRKMTQPLTFEEVEVPLDKTKPHPIHYRDLDLLELVELCSPQQQVNFACWSLVIKSDNWRTL